MYISLAESCANGFKKWSDAHQPHSNDDDGDVAKGDVIAIRISGFMTPAAGPMARARSE